MLDRKFGFRPTHNTSLQAGRLVETITMNFRVNKPTGSVFLDVAKTLVTVWIDGLLYKLTLLNFSSLVVHKISPYLRGWTFESSFQTASSSRRGMPAGVAQCGMISLVFLILYIKDMPSPSHHVGLAPNADDTAIIATSRKPTLFVIYLESYLNDLHRWLSDWRITINVSKSTAIIFARAPILRVDTTRYLGVTVDTRLNWSPHIYQVRNKTAQKMGILVPLLNR
jgi:hypothetical protein